MDAHEGQAAWAGAIGSIIALGIAILVPVMMAWAQRRREERELLRRRRAAWRTMTVIIESLGRREEENVYPGEVWAMSNTLDHLDLSIFPEEAILALVSLRHRVAEAADGVSKRQGMSGAAPLLFNSGAALESQKSIREVMGMGNEPVPGAKGRVRKRFHAMRSHGVDPERLPAEDIDT